MQLTEQQNADLMRMAAWRPCMIVAGAVHPDTGEFRIVVGPTKAKANNLARRGWVVHIVRKS